MNEQERPLMDRVWEFTKDLSVKVSRKAEKHWKINTLRVEIASVRHRINVKYKELGRYVYESVKSQTLEEDSYKASLREFFDELKRLEGEILQRENRIEILEQEMREFEKQRKSTPPPIPEAPISSVSDEDSETASGEPASETGPDHLEEVTPSGEDESHQDTPSPEEPVAKPATKKASASKTKETKARETKAKSATKTTPRKRTPRSKKTE